MKKSVNRNLKVFLCHAKLDKTRVLEYYKKLVKLGIDTWFDTESLLPGQDWRKEIPKAIRNSDVVIVFLSWESITREGYVNTEIKYALDIAGEKPEGEIFIIPARLEDCGVPVRLEDLHWVDLFENDGFRSLLKSLNRRGESLGINYFDLVDNINLAEDNQRTSLKNSDNTASTLLKYLKGLTYLHQTEPSTLKSLMTLVKIELIKSSNRKLNHYQDLAVLMLEDNYLEYVLSAAKELILTPDTLSQFFTSIGYPFFKELPSPKTLVKQFMGNLESGIILEKDSKILNMIEVIRNASPSVRYLLIVNENTRALQGVISINDISRNFEATKRLSRDTLLVDLPYFNNNPRVVFDNDTLENAIDIFNNAQKAGKKITLIIVVNEKYMPVGQVSEIEIARWEASSID